MTIPFLMIVQLIATVLASLIPEREHESIEVIPLLELFGVGTISFEEERSVSMDRAFVHIHDLIIEYAHKYPHQPIYVVFQDPTKIERFPGASTRAFQINVNIQLHRRWNPNTPVFNIRTNLFFSNRLYDFSRNHNWSFIGIRQGNLYFCDDAHSYVKYETIPRTWLKNLERTKKKHLPRTKLRGSEIVTLGLPWHYGIMVMRHRRDELTPCLNIREFHIDDDYGLTPGRTINAIVNLRIRHALRSFGICWPVSRIVEEFLGGIDGLHLSSLATCMDEISYDDKTVRWTKYSGSIGPYTVEKRQCIIF